MVDGLWWGSGKRVVCEGEVVGARRRRCEAELEQTVLLPLDSQKGRCCNVSTREAPAGKLCVGTGVDDAARCSCPSAPDWA